MCMVHVGICTVVQFKYASFMDYRRAGFKCDCVFGISRRLCF